MFPYAIDFEAIFYFLVAHKTLDNGVERDLSAGLCQQSVFSDFHPHRKGGEAVSTSSSIPMSPGAGSQGGCTVGDGLSTL